MSFPSLCNFLTSYSLLINSYHREDREDYAEILDIRAENFKKSSKLIALFEHIHDIRKKKEKCVVFSQFIGMLNLIQKCLEEEKIPFRVNSYSLVIFY